METPEEILQKYCPTINRHTDLGQNMLSAMDEYGYIIREGIINKIKEEIVGEKFCTEDCEENCFHANNDDIINGIIKKLKL